MKYRISMKTMMVIAGVIFLNACAGVSLEGERGESKNNSSQYFYQHWINSYEEQTAGQVVFRPQGSMEFPPSRFRMAYIFNIDGSCQYKYLSPVDAHRMENCVYTKVGNKVYIYDETGKLIPDLSFTLSSPARKDVMYINKGIQKPEPSLKANKAEQK